MYQLQAYYTGMKQHMDPLTTQEMSVIGDNHNDRVESEKDALTNEMQDSDHQNSETGIDKDPFLHPKNCEDVGNRLDNTSNVRNTFSNNYTIGIALTKHGFHNETVNDDTLFAIEPIFQSPDAGVLAESFSHSTFDSKEVSFAAEKSVLINEQYGEDFDDINTTCVPATSPSSTNQSMDHRERVSDLGEAGDPTSSFDSPTAESVTFNLSVNTQYDTTLEPIITSDQYLEAKSLVSDENVDTSNMLEFPAEGDKLFLEAHSANRDELSGIMLDGSGANLSAMEQNEDGTRSSYDSTNSEAIFVSAGIPAPSSVPAALQALPGKVLIPAVIDQVQGQALAALQVLKVFLFSFI